MLALFMGKVKFTCKFCGKYFEAVPSAPHKRYCSFVCRRKSHNRRRRKPPPAAKNCIICSCTFVPNKYHPNHQILCGANNCSKARKRELNRIWYLENLHLFRTQLPVQQSLGPEVGKLASCLGISTRSPITRAPP